MTAMADQPGSEKGPSICMPTWRHFDLCAYQAPRYESQDVLAECADLHLIPLKPSWAFKTREYWHRRLVWRDFTGALSSANPGLSKIRLDRDYDVFVVACQTLKEILYLNAVENWKDRCRKSVCIIDELYAGEVEHSRNFLKLLRKFDYVFTELGESVEPISRVIGRPCYYLPAAVDTLRFTPFVGPWNRSVDVYSIGRRRQTVHEELLKLAAKDHIFYIYDTFQGGGEARVTDYRSHRDLTANTAKRSKFFMVAPAKWDKPEETRGQIAIASRYFEGTAAGAVLLGQATPTHEFERMFDWPQIVVPIAPDGSDIRDVIMSLQARPAALETIGRRNASEAMMRHDWVYRWRSMLEHIGERPGAALRARESRLHQIAQAGLAGKPAPE